jgi:threonine/homoserine/homoserine lactone efflux protein
MTMELVLALAAFALITSITPGPNNLMVMASGANFGVRRTLSHLIGVLVGFNIMIWLVGAGVYGLINAYPASIVVLKTASAVLLIYFAWKIATAGAPGETEGSLRGKPLTFIQAAAFQWVNPKAWALSLAAIGAYATETRPLVSLATIAAVFLAAGIPSVGTWLMLGTQLRRLLTNRLRLKVFNWICAVLLLLTLWPIFSGGSIAP